MSNFDVNSLSEFRYSLWHDFSLAELKLFKPEQVELNGNQIIYKLGLPFSWQQQASLEQELSEFLAELDPTLQLQLEVSFEVSKRHSLNDESLAKGVKNIIAVSSAKGGVGKSSVTVNLAAAMANSGAKVGILDADIYGPSIPHMLGVSELKPTSHDQKTMEPVVAANGKLVANSIGFLVGETNPTIWRGPVASTMLTQLLAETNWGELDYLFIDMPPGTGDIQLTVAQKLPLTASVIVSTPQEIALLDVLKGVNMFKELDVPVLGIIENMSMFTCPSCGFQAHLFGKDGVKEMAEILQTPLLSSLPLNPQVGRDLDDGNPTPFLAPESEISKDFTELADRVSFALYREIKPQLTKISIKQL